MLNNRNLNNSSEGNFVVYSSSAGSGKTYTLTRFFIKLLLHSDDPKYFRTIVAITFTNKAANEMKERIFQNLLLLSEDLTQIKDENRRKEITDLREDYLKFIAISEEELIRKSKQIVFEILHNYSDLTVQTIDKFTHKIIRPFARDLDVSPDFNIELGEDEIVSKSIDVLLQDTGKDEYLTQILLDFAEFKIDEGKRYQDFEREISDLCAVFKKEDAISHLKSYKEHSVAFFFEQKNKLREQQKVNKSKLVLAGAKAIKLMNAHSVSVSDFYQGKKGVGGLFLTLSKGEVKNSTGKYLEFNKYHQKAIDEDVWYSKSSKNPGGIDAIKNQLKELLLQIPELLSSYITTQFLYQRMFPTALLNEVEKVIEEVKTTQNILTLSDFNKMISSLINSSHLSVPFLYERIGSRYNHYLIDEFQDTSILQWNNLLPLVDDSLSKGKENLVVGDGKQAIYRWRNGDVEQFVSLPDIPHKPNENYNYIEKTLNRELFKDNLDTNYRSYSNVIKFNNMLYRSIAQNLNSYHQKIYNDVEQNTTKKDGGYVSVDIVNKEDLKQGDVNLKFKEYALEQCIKNVDEAINNGFLEKEIAIIVRNNNEIKPIAQRLIEEGKAVVSDESLRLSASTDVQILIAFLRFVDDNKNTGAILSLLLLLFPDFDAEKQQEIIKSQSLFNELQTNYGIDDSVFYQPIYTLIQEASNAFSLDQTSAYFIQFKNFIWNRFKKDGVSLSDFIRLWNELEEDERIPSLKTTETSDAIRIMTIHKSKGLQFPVVILPFVAWSTNLRTTVKWINTESLEGIDYLAANISSSSVKNTPYEHVVEEELEEILLESLNMLYVATTRAEEQLYICVDGDKKGSIGELFTSITNQFEGTKEGKIELGDKTRLSLVKTFVPTNQININKQTRVKPVELKIAPESNKIWGESDQKELDYGNLFHYQVSRIKTVKGVSKLEKRIKEELSSETELATQLIEDINLMLKNEKIRNIFDDGNVVYNEQEIKFSSTIFRIDKLAILPNNSAIILDFKTGEEKIQDYKQVNQYKGALNALGFSQVSSFLYYTKSKTIHEV